MLGIKALQAKDSLKCHVDGKTPVGDHASLATAHSASSLAVSEHYSDPMAVSQSVISAIPSSPKAHGI